MLRPAYATLTLDLGTPERREGEESEGERKKFTSNLSRKAPKGGILVE